MVTTSGIDRAVAALREGRIVGVPTDTVYGIAADPFSERGVRALFAAKDRPAVMPIPILVANPAQAALIGDLDESALTAAAVHWPGALTLVVPRAAGLPDWIGHPERGSVGVRVPDHPVTLALLSLAGPLAVTSANRSGYPAAPDDRAARAALGDAVAVYLEGGGGGGAASTVVDLTGSEPQVLRVGPVAWPVD
ncbi:MAG: L-threonylcarbamoyladenylate synthase [Acidimicrobiia bacterium]|nr:L-threonylcarbamoyladenylate synthase [Acidimicrobiia bacterium]